MMTHPRQTPAPQHPSPSPRQIAAGIGQATRQEICGMLAMQDAARISQIAADLGDAALRKLGSDAGPTVDRITAFAKGLMDGPIPTDALRARLWLTLKQALGLPGLYPLSRRGLESEAAAMAVRASQVLAPSVAKARQDRDDAGASALGRSGRNLLRAASGARRRAREAVTFPDIVAHELAVTMEALAEADRRGELDPEVAAAIRKGQRAISTAAFAGGGWAALATAIGGAAVGRHPLRCRPDAGIAALRDDQPGHRRRGHCGPGVLGGQRSGDRRASGRGGAGCGAAGGAWPRRG